MPELKIYTVKDLQEWLENNHPAEGLSERVIAPTRAWAIMHNPYVKENDAIVAAIFEDGELAAYTASFPDMLNGKRVWWCSTLYCYPQFAGHGYGMIVVGSLMEAHEPDLTYDRWGAPETVEICKALGLQTIYTVRYHLSDKAIHVDSWKGKLAACAQSLNKCLHPWPKLSRLNYTLRYASYIDGETYAFMRTHKGKDLWLREQIMLNWIVRYPFAQGCTLHNRVAKDSEFSSNMPSYEYKIVKVYINDHLSSVYMLRFNKKALSLIYLYYEEKRRNQIFNSIIDHIVTMAPKSFITDNKELCAYVRERLYFPKYEEEKVSLSLPEIEDGISLQFGEGDCFA